MADVTSGDVSPTSLAALHQTVTDCRRCPRLVAWREAVGRSKRAAYAAEDYWARPVPGFGDPAAWLLVVGLAPAAHGGNRTGRVFTGDRSGDWLFRALYRAGLGNQPESTARDDGLVLTGAYVTAAVHCAPPDNKPLPVEWSNCRPYLDLELDLLTDLSVVVCLGAFAYIRVLTVLRERGLPVPRPTPAFAHGRVVPLGALTVLGSYHPSQQNTFTGRLTAPMFDAIWDEACRRGAERGQR